MSGQSKERFMRPFIIGASLLFFIGVAATVVLPFYDEVMQRENANAKIKTMRSTLLNTVDARFTSGKAATYAIRNSYGL